MVATVSGAYRGGMTEPLVQLPTTDAEWRVRLSPEEFRVLRLAGTEAPWSGEYVNTKTDGVYRCRACGEQLFESGAKFDSHCGWPSFDDAIPGTVKEIEDRSHGMVRTEIRCARCDSHLGHVFRGERMTEKNTRHCVNSLSITLEPNK
ncbi:peptide-methionine (R)-S-oxide reductase MsrB [Dactylosporangium darangshiense]|uniref:peptide-methionine (R)-S-oxide reductase n=2 Tax=Dactylosporangium darangshiense TaxID=579108 RepID=A0ABP8D338_9ACTN